MGIRGGGRRQRIEGEGRDQRGFWKRVEQVYEVKPNRDNIPMRNMKYSVVSA